ncbi:MAG: MBL fold metallo-hydrolase [Chloroflexi bacterium]|nr:MBL fold metallo-hydrolase [Chloroflexota bacterium]
MTDKKSPSKLRSHRTALLPGTTASTLGMMMQYLGHSALYLSSPGRVRVVIDPYQNKRGGTRWFTRRFPVLKANIVVSTHDHFDHNAIKDIGGLPAVLKNRGRVKLNDVDVKLIPEIHSEYLHRKASSGNQMLNHLVTVESHGVRLCHVGDNRVDISAEALQALGRVDVLAVPVDDDEHLLTFAEVDQMIEAISPRVVLPIHYLQKGITADTADLGGITKWLEHMRQHSEIRYSDTSRIVLSQAEMERVDGLEIWPLSPAIASGRSVI